MIGWKRVPLTLMVVLGLSCAGTPPPTDPAMEAAFFPETISITGIEAQHEGNVTDIVVKGNFPFNYSSFQPDPSRLVIEVPAAEATGVDEVIPLEEGEVEEIHVTTERTPGGSQIARLEFVGLTSDRHDFFLEGNHLRIRFFGSDPSSDSSLDRFQEGTEVDAGNESSDYSWDGPESAGFGEPEWEQAEYGESIGEEAMVRNEDLPLLSALEESADLDEAMNMETEADPLLPVSPAESLLNVEMETTDDSISFRFLADGELEIKDFRLESPDRTVFDLIGVTNRVPFQSLQVDSEFLRQVRVAQFQNQPERITRVVFDLNSSREYAIHTMADGVQVEFAPLGGFPTVAKEFDPAGAFDPFKEEEEESEVAIPPLLAEVGPADEGMEGNFFEPEFDEDVSPDFSQETDPEWEFEPAEDSEGNSDPAAGEEVISNTVSEVENVPDETKVVETAEKIEPPTQEKPTEKDSTTVILKPAEDAYSGRTISGGSKVYGGPLISLDFKDADIKDVFRLFHEILGFNIVLDPSVNGKLTIVLDQVPADQALDIILRNNGLDKVFENNVIRVATTLKLAQEAAARRQLMEAKELEQEPMTFARKLSYAKASEVAKLLRESGGTGTSGGILSKKGNVRFDDRTNTLIITDIPKNMESINRLVDLLDEETPQVMIEARIVETDRDFERNFGIRWGFNVDLDPAIGTETNSRFPHRVNADFDVNLPAPAAASTLGLSFGNIRDSIDLFFTLEAFELNGDIKILSAPRIATQNNETAVIEQGTQIPVVNTTATEINVEFISASLRLEVTPQITKDRTIIMDVLVDNSSPDFGNRVGDVPPIITERAETQILVEDGGTAVIGGIYRLDEAFTEVGIPGLKRIPLLGWLFKNRSVSRRNTELLIFLTPTIIERD